jgi:hypothetical protein
LKTRFLIVIPLVLLLLGGSSLVAARALDGYAIEWWTTDGGGGTSSGASFSLSGTIGQADAGQMSGGGYTLSGGYWGNAAPPQDYEIFLPITVHDSK